MRFFVLGGELVVEGCVRSIDFADQQPTTQSTRCTQNNVVIGPRIRPLASNSRICGLSADHVLISRVQDRHAPKDTPQNQPPAIHTATKSAHMFAAIRSALCFLVVPVVVVAEPT